MSEIKERKEKKEREEKILRILDDAPDISDDDIKFLIDNNNLRVGGYESILTLACRKSNDFIIKLLLDSGIKVKKYYHGTNPIEAYMFSNNSSDYIISLLVEAGADPNDTYDRLITWNVNDTFSNNLKKLIPYINKKTAQKHIKTFCNNGEYDIAKYLYEKFDLEIPENSLNCRKLYEKSTLRRQINQISLIGKYPKSLYTNEQIADLKNYGIDMSKSIEKSKIFGPKIKVFSNPVLKGKISEFLGGKLNQKQWKSISDLENKKEEFGKTNKRMSRKTNKMRRKTKKTSRKSIRKK